MVDSKLKWNDKPGVKCGVQTRNDDGQQKRQVVDTYFEGSPVVEKHADNVLEIGFFVQYERRHDWISKNTVHGVRFETIFGFGFAVNQPRLCTSRFGGPHVVRVAEKLISP